jgi:hypothetical protein
MESVIIIADRDWEFEATLRTLPPAYAVTALADRQVLIERGGCRAYLGPDPRVAGELEPDEEARIRLRIAEPVFYTLDFSDISLCKELLMAIADRHELLIDNDHGVLLPGSEFVRRLQAQKQWDWRFDGT